MHGAVPKCLESSGRRGSLARACLPSLCKECDSPVPQALSIDRDARLPLSNVAPLCRGVFGQFAGLVQLQSWSLMMREPPGGRTGRQQRPTRTLQAAPSTCELLASDRPRDGL